MFAVRTGQPHRTLLGHTAPVTCLQFDELHIVSGSLDKSIRVRLVMVRVLRACCDPFIAVCEQIWDVRTGGIFETLKYDHAVTALQFDTRKIVAATGENGVKVRFFPRYGNPDAFPILACRGLGRRWNECLPFVLVLSQIYNRTSMQHSTLMTNGHTRPVERLRYMDRYMVSGGRDSIVKIWAL